MAFAIFAGSIADLRLLTGKLGARYAASLAELDELRIMDLVRLNTRRCDRSVPAVSAWQSPWVSPAKPAPHLANEPALRVTSLD